MRVINEVKMQTTNQNTNLENSKDYLAEREAVKKTMAKMEKELDKPAIHAVFKRLKNK